MRRGWTQIDFALQAHVSPATVQRWERGQLPRVRELLRVSELLKIDAESLVEPSHQESVEGGMSERLERIEQEAAASKRESHETNELLRELLARLAEEPGTGGAGESD